MTAATNGTIVPWRGTELFDWWWAKPSFIEMAISKRVLHRNGHFIQRRNPTGKVCQSLLMTISLWKWPFQEFQKWTKWSFRGIHFNGFQEFQIPSKWPFCENHREMVVLWNLEPESCEGSMIISLWFADEMVISAWNFAQNGHSSVMTYTYVWLTISLWSSIASCFRTFAAIAVLAILRHDSVLKWHTALCTMYMSYLNKVWSNIVYLLGLNQQETRSGINKVRPFWSFEFGSGGDYMTFSLGFCYSELQTSFLILLERQWSVSK